MLLHAVTLLLPTVLCISQAHTTTTLPTSHQLESTPLHSHTSPRVSTTEGVALVKIKQGDPIHVSMYPSEASKPSSSAAASPTTSQCPPLQISCGSVGCYNPNTDRCCDEKNICNLTHNCVEVQQDNGTIASGCCPSGTLACDDTCFDTTTFRCCASPGGAHGLCLASQDCCGNMCCDEGEVCANGFLGPICWQRHNNSTGRIESSPSLPAPTAMPSTQKSGSIRVSVPKMFHVLSLCIQFMASLPEQGFLATRLQSLPTRRGIEGLDAGNSTPQIISMNPAAKEAYDSMATITVPVLRHTPTRVEVDNGLSEKIGGGGHGSCGHGSGGRGGHHNIGARCAIPSASLIFVWIGLPEVTAML